MCAINGGSLFSLLAKNVLPRLWPDQRVLRIPQIQAEAHGREEIQALRARVLDSISITSVQLVDIHHEYGERNLVKIRMIWKMEQVKPLFPNLPVHTPITVGMQHTIETNDEG